MKICCREGKMDRFNFVKTLTNVGCVKFSFSVSRWKKVRMWWGTISKRKVQFKRCASTKAKEGWVIGKISIIAFMFVLCELWKEMDSTFETCDQAFSFLHPNPKFFIPVPPLVCLPPKAKIDAISHLGLHRHLYKSFILFNFTEDG